MSQSMVFTTVVGPSFVPALVEVGMALQERYPTLSNDQVREMIVVRGIVGYVDDLNLPRVGSNTDVDG